MTRVIVQDGVRSVIIEPEDDDVCEMCGAVEETRPYGPKKADGTRMRVCYSCGMKDEAEATRAFKELLGIPEGH